MSINLNKIKLGYSPLSEEIYLYRHGKKEGVALDKRLAEKDVMAVITEKMMDGTENGSEMEYHFGDKRYRIRIEPLNDAAKTT